MPSIFSITADTVAYEPFDEWDEERGEHVASGCVHFLPADGIGNGADFLTLSREQVFDRGVRRYVGPVTISVEGAVAEAGITRAELRRHELWLVLDADAAAEIEVDEIRVHFELNDAAFAELRRELGELLAGETVLRVDEAG